MSHFLVYLFTLGIVIGLYAYSIFFYGVTSMLSPFMVIFLTVPYVIALGVILAPLISAFAKVSELAGFEKMVTVLLAFFCVVNLLGALGPETSFDALWYHLTLPKIYLESQSIFFIPGGLLYYSAMPKLTEMLYIPGILIGGETLVKCIHYFFGIITLLTLYLLSRIFVNRSLSLLTAATLAGNLVFSWELTVAFNDLTWMFYETLSFLAFIHFIKSKEAKWIVLTGVFTGFAITTKLVGVLSVIIYVSLLGYLFLNKKLNVSLLKTIISYILPVVIIPLPWLIFSYINTGNPFYPFFTGLLASYENSFMSINTFNPLNIISKLLSYFLFPSDPVSPIYLIVFPLFFFVRKKLTIIDKLVVIYTFLCVFLLLVIPKSGGARFLLPYLPILSLAVVITLSKLKAGKTHVYIYYLTVVGIIFVLGTSIIYRGVANARNIPYLLGKETKGDFLTKHLNFQFGDFYDTGSYFEKSIKETDRVLLMGFHNLYYVSFPFVHESWYRGEPITHIAIQNGELPEKYKSWKLLYTNTITNVKVYEKPQN